MSYRSYGSRRKRRVARSLIGLLILVALVFGVWMLFLSNNAPLAKVLADNASKNTAAPAATPTMPSTEPDPTAEPTDDATAEPQDAQTTAVPAPVQVSSVATAQPLVMQTSSAATAAPVVTSAPTAEPVATAEPAATAEPVATAQPTAEPVAATAQPTATAEPVTDTAEPVTTAEPTPEPTRQVTTIAQMLSGGIQAAQSVTTPTPEPEVTAAPTAFAAVATALPAASAAPTANPTALPTAEPVVGTIAPTDSATAAPAQAVSDEPTPMPTSRYQLPAGAPPLSQQVSNAEAALAILNETLAPTLDPAEFNLNDPTPTPEGDTTPEPQATPEPASGPRGTVTLSSGSGNLNLRSEPSTNGAVLASLPHGTQVTIIEHSGNWVKISANGREGYVREDFLTIEEDVVEQGLLYRVEVDRGMQVVRVYTLDENGEYTTLAREMICSTDSFESKPPNGTYACDGEKLRWLTTFSGTYAQYATRITSHILFHSIPYESLNPDTLIADEYDNLGNNVSIGCVRLACADAKWVYENIPAGTPIEFMTGERDEEKLNELAVPPLVSGRWDPTDDNPENPDYTAEYAESHPAATPVPDVTPAPTTPWIPSVY